MIVVAGSVEPSEMVSEAAKRLRAVVLEEEQEASGNPESGGAGEMATEYAVPPAGSSRPFLIATVRRGVGCARPRISHLLAGAVDRHAAAKGSLVSFLENVPR